MRNIFYLKFFESICLYGIKGGRRCDGLRKAKPGHLIRYPANSYRISPFSIAVIGTGRIDNRIETGIDFFK